MEHSFLRPFNSDANLLGESLNDHQNNLSHWRSVEVSLLNFVVNASFYPIKCFCPLLYVKRHISWGSIYLFLSVFCILIMSFSIA